MDKDRKAGFGKKIIGSIKQAAGKITGDNRMRAEGTADKTVGKAQNAGGGAKDTMRDTLSS